MKTKEDLLPLGTEFTFTFPADCLGRTITQRYRVKDHVTVGRFSGDTSTDNWAEELEPLGSQSERGGGK